MKYLFNIKKYIEWQKNLKDAIALLPDSPHKHFKPKIYTDLVYKAVTGMIKEKLKESRGYKEKAKPNEFLTIEELEKITEIGQKVVVLIGAGLGYESIKRIVYGKYLTGNEQMSLI